MLLIFGRMLHYRYLPGLVALGMILVMLCCRASAQSLGDPLVRITFGSYASQYAGPLHPDSGYTSYAYVSRSPEDNEYTIANSTLGMNTGWVLTSDHTGDPNGMMMVVNASREPGLFYTRTVTGLCGSTRFQFSAWIKNILRRTNGILPNVTFTIEDKDGNILGGGETHDIFATNTWNQYGFVFETPANVQSVVLKMINNAPGGGGNDLAIDDIEFRPYGAPVNVVLDRAGTEFCEGISEAVVMRATTPLPTNYSAKFQILAGTKWTDISNPTTDPRYTINTPTVAGTYHYRMVTADAGNIDSPPCVIASNFLSLTVLPLPVAAMDVPNEICMEGVTFKDASTARLADLAAWHWDFGDGQTSTDRNPVHSYANPGNYTVTLYVTNSKGCQSTPVTKNIRVITPVNNNFTFSTPGCQTQAVTFTDISTSVEGNIINRIWDFDDGTPPVQRTDASPFTHVFDVAKTYNVKLTIITDKGCQNVRTHQVIVNPLPEVNFILPEVCYADYYATFVDSTFVNGSNAGLTYRWHFGDSFASATDNASTNQNPQHHYSQTGLYKVTLTVLTAEGCEFTREKELYVNGYPIPAFEVPNQNALCVNKPALFINKATASLGNITKIEWFFDADHNSTVPDLVDDEPRPDKVYSFNYPIITYPQDKMTYKVRMVAYTGQAGDCQAIAEEVVTVLASPVLEFTPPEIVCLNDAPLQLSNYYREVSGIPGRVQFSGPGVTGDMFDPKAAGVGEVAITCIYEAAGGAGCVDEVSVKVLVKPIATNVDAGATVYVLAGNTTSLQATATGTNLKYLWTPATGLSDATIPNPTVSALQNTTTYTLSVSMDDGLPGAICTVEDMVTVVVLKTPGIPNTFTPNGDGINDTWEIKNLQDYESASVNIFNRNGQRVFSSIGYKTPWDGRMNGNYLPVGVYYYIIDPKQGRKQVTGYVTIVR